MALRNCNSKCFQYSSKHVWIYKKLKLQILPVLKSEPVWVLDLRGVRFAGPQSSAEVWLMSMTCTWGKKIKFKTWKLLRRKSSQQRVKSSFFGQFCPFFWTILSDRNFLSEKRRFYSFFAKIFFVFGVLTLPPGRFRFFCKLLAQLACGHRDPSSNLTRGKLA